MAEEMFDGFDHTRTRRRSSSAGAPRRMRSSDAWWRAMSAGRGADWKARTVDLATRVGRRPRRPGTTRRRERGAGPRRVVTSRGSGASPGRPGTAPRRCGTTCSGWPTCTWPTSGSPRATAGVDGRDVRPGRAARVRRPAPLRAGPPRGGVSPPATARASAASRRTAPRSVHRSRRAAPVTRPRRRVHRRPRAPGPRPSPSTAGVR